MSGSVNRRPLQTIVITRPEGPYSGGVQLASLVRAEGLQPFGLPVLSCQVIPEPVGDPALGDRHWRELLEDEAAWLAFLSPTAVHVCAQLCHQGLGIPAHTRIAAQGIGTALAVEECFGRAPAFIPTVFVAEVFADELAERIRESESGVSRVIRAGHNPVPTGTKLGPVVIPQSENGRDVVGPRLRSAGIHAHGVHVYRLVPLAITHAMREAFLRLNPDTTAAVFMSPSAVQAAVEGLGTDAVDHLRAMEVISVGPITSHALRGARVPVAHEAQEHSERGIIEILRGRGRL